MQRSQNGIGSEDGIRIRCGVSAEKISETAHLLLGSNGTRDDAVEQLSRFRRECFDHGVRRLADGNYEAAAVAVDIEKVFANSQRAHAQHAATFEIDVAVERASDARLRQGLGEDLAGWTL